MNYEQVRVGVVGTHGGGKTSLVNWLEARFTCQVVDEVARSRPKHLPLSEHATIDTQRWILAEQIYREANCTAPLVICDRTTLDELAYATWVFKERRCSELDFENFRKVALSWANTYDLLFYIPVEIPLVADGVRSTDPRFQRYIDAVIKEILRPFRYHTLTGSIKKRGETAARIIEDEQFAKGARRD